MNNKVIIGLDEVGRGAWAGPLCVAAVRLRTTVLGLNDSKQLDRFSRERLSSQIHENNDVSIVWVKPSMIDEIGLGLALRMAFEDAYKGLNPHPNEIICVDGRTNYLSNVCDTAEVLVRADTIIPAVMAASIVAKVARDAYMRDQSATFAIYGFESNVGYGTLSHRLAIKQFGICMLHRMSIKPLQKYIHIAKTMQK